MIKNIAEFIKASPTSEHGCMATFVPVNETYGFKFYRDKKFAQNEYNKSKHAAKYGLGPKVGDFVGFIVDRIEYDEYTQLCWRFGFFVERVETLTKRTGKHWSHFETEHAAAKDRIVWSKHKLPNLGNKLRKIFEYTNDLHAENVGFLPNGKFVCIDFDQCRFPIIPLTKKKV